MPTKPSLHLASPSSSSLNHSANRVKDGLTVTSRKPPLGHIEPYKSPANTPRRPSFSMDSILHPYKDKAKRNDSKDRGSDGKDKRLSLSMIAAAKSKERRPSQSSRPPSARAGRFEFVIESPPLVLYGGISNSTGALLSGRLTLFVEDPTGAVALKSFDMQLRCIVTSRRPLQKDCDECKEHFDVIKEWRFLSEPKTFRKDDDNQFPFSHLLPGQIPATTHVLLGSVSYGLFATATTSTGETIEVSRPLVILRALPPGPDKASIRIFPPTNLTARVVLPPIIHPIGTFPLQMMLSGVVERKADFQTRWRLRKVMWRIEEHVKMVSVPCAKHGVKLGVGKGIQHEEVKELGNGEMKSGWKTDFDTAGGEIAMEFDASLSTKASHKPICNVTSSGLEVKHILVLELIVAEEFCPNKNSSIITPTGSARVLRMQFALVVTQRAGMGISWDEEMPPVYEDVPPSPPGYGRADQNDGAFGGAIMEDYHGPELEYEDLEQLPHRRPGEPPRYRERDSAHISPAEPSAPQRRRTASMDDEEEEEEEIIVRDRRSQRIAGWNEEDFGAEPRYALRHRQASEQQQMIEEDYGEGSASAAPAN